VCVEEAEEERRGHARRATITRVEEDGCRGRGKEEKGHAVPLTHVTRYHDPSWITALTPCSSLLLELTTTGFQKPLELY
jgi:hypothetical protein